MKKKKKKSVRFCEKSAAGQFDIANANGASDEAKGKKGNRQRKRKDRRQMGMQTPPPSLSLQLQHIYVKYNSEVGECINGDIGKRPM